MIIQTAIGTDIISEHDFLKGQKLKKRVVCVCTHTLSITNTLNKIHLKGCFINDTGKVFP